MTISELIKSLAIDIQPGIHFLLADEFQANAEADEFRTWTGDAVILNDAIVSSVNFAKSGALTEIIPLEILILGQDEDFSKSDFTEQIVERCKTHAAKLLLSLQADTNIKAPGRNIEKATITWVKHLYDKNLSGVLLRVEFPAKLPY